MVGGLLLFILLLGVPVSQETQAQDLPPQRQIRTYIPPEQIVNFLPNLPFGEFVNQINPVFAQATGKRVIDPESRSFPISISIVGMYFFDAFETVLEIHNLMYRETEQYFIVEAAPPPTVYIEPQAPGKAARTVEAIATSQSREIQIEAVLFEVNLTKLREQGIDWSILLGTDTRVRTSGQVQREGTTQIQQPRFFLKTARLFEGLDEWMFSPQLVDVAILARFFRFAENEGLGETVANPSISVKSGEKGRIQIGSDIPVTTRDFAGNTLTQFVSTGMIIDVTPTLIREPLADSAGSPLFEFMNLDVQVERSSGRPFGGSVAIDRSSANTKVLLLDGEMTVIGGLYSNDLTSSRRGLPILKDLPPWFFGLRYIFGYEERTTVQRELIIALQAHVRESLPSRAARPLPDEVRDDYRRQVLETIGRFNSKMGDDLPLKKETGLEPKRLQAPNPRTMAPPPSMPVPGQSGSSSGTESGGG